MSVYRIVAPHLCAGLVVVNGIVTEAAPILKYMRGWQITRVRGYCNHKGWTVEMVSA